MIEVHKGGFNIGPKYINVYVDVQLDENNPDEYVSGIGASIDSEAIANLALKESNCFDTQKFGEFGEIIREYIRVDADDAYDYKTIDEMLNNRDENHYSRWLERFTELYDCITDVEYNGKHYKCYINIFMNK